MKIALSLPITLFIALFVSQLPGSAAADPYNKMPPPKAPPTHNKPPPEAAPRPRIPPPAIDAVQRRPGEKPGAGAGSDEDLDSLLGEPAGPAGSKPPSKSTTGPDDGIGDIDIDLGEPGAAGASAAPPPPTPPSEPAPAPAAPKPLKPDVANQMSALLAGGDGAPDNKVKLTQTGTNLRTGAQTYEFSVDGKKYVLTVPKDGNSEMVKIGKDGSAKPVEVPPNFGRKTP